MSKSKGYAALTAKTALAPYSFERREPREHDVVIDIKYCGICHSDIHQARDEWSEYQEEAIFPMVPGHEIGGVVSAVGSKVAKHKVGDKVGVGCFVDSCRSAGFVKRRKYWISAASMAWHATSKSFRFRRSTKLTSVF
jgi:alcohol dehydrogenase (NADP+)